MKAERGLLPAFKKYSVEKKKAGDGTYGKEKSLPFKKNDRSQNKRQ